MSNNMSEDVVLSVIIPVYNKKEFIGECIESVLNNGLDSIEVVVVNDGSTDGGDLICEQYANESGKVKYISQKNAGVAAARNTGINNATGEYVTFLDADDSIDAGAFEYMIKKIRKADCDILEYGFKRERGGVVRDLPIIDKEIIFDSPETIRRFSIALTMGDVSSFYSHFGVYQGYSVCNHVYRKKLISDNGLSFFSFWNNEDDWLFNVNAYPCAGKVIMLPDCFYNYRVVKGSVSNEKKYIGDIYDKRLKSYEYIKNHLEKLEADKDTIASYLGDHKRKSILYSLYDVTTEKCPLSKKQALVYLKYIVKNEKNLVDKTYYLKASKVEKIYLKLMMGGFVKLVYTVNKYMLKKYYR